MLEMTVVQYMLEVLIPVPGKMSCCIICAGNRINDTLSKR